MILSETYSEVGRCTGQHLDNLRRQLGVGIDPAYDYSHITELQKKLTAKKEKKPKDDGLSGSGALDQLRSALHEATNPMPLAEDAAETADAVLSPHRRTANQGSKAHLSPSASFKVASRDYHAALAIEARWRAPPPGSYRAKTEVIEPRTREISFGERSPTRGRHVLKFEQEVAQLKEEGKPFDHLTKSCTSVELLDEKPEKARPRLHVWNFAKDSERPDIVKQAGIVFNHNTFDEGVMSGDLNTSKFLRRPVYDFGKNTSPEKQRETFFQPGQYKVNLGCIRASSEIKNIPFERQTARKPLRETVGRTEIKSRAGDHLPDRSLSRSCPAISTYTRQNVPTFDNYTERPPMAKIQKPYHKADDPEIDADVFQRMMTHDELEASKATWSKSRTTEKFEASLDRKSQLRTQRSYGEDIPMQRAKDNIKYGPVSVELLSEVGTSPILRPRVLIRDFGASPERDHNQKKHAVPASRAKDMSESMKFGRGARPGDGKSEADMLSPTAATISRLRSSRKFEGLEIDDSI
mmetsp:Transcript_2778/g.10974  ORF Transcript_2778/g.10974 Transcript_2778/m.10974 type:complete len:523 (+) Transcript_2778:111-1679(+)